MVKSRHLLTSAVAAASCLLVPTQVNASNLVVNGGFELPVLPANTPMLYGIGFDIDGWEVFGEGDVAVLNGSFAQAGLLFTHDEGVQSLDLTGLSNVLTGVRQTIATVAGQKYTLSLAVGNVQSIGPIWGQSSSVQILIDGNPFSVATNSGGPSNQLGWQTFSYEFTAAGEATTLSFLNLDDEFDNVNQIDSISVTAAIPEPSSALMLVVGLSSLFAVRKSVLRANLQRSAA